MEAEDEMQKALLSLKWEMSSLIEEAAGGGGRPHATARSLCPSPTLEIPWGTHLPAPQWAAVSRSPREAYSPEVWKTRKRWERE